jgi:hypothetical protein
METMKVRVVLTLEVNVEGWMMDYGIPKSEVREDVVSYVRTLMHEVNQNIELKPV